MEKDVQGVATNRTGRCWHDQPIVNRRPKLDIVAPAASPEEAAAIVAALERFMRDTAPTPAPAPPGGMAPWAEAALLEATGHVPGEPVLWRRSARRLP